MKWTNTFVLPLASLLAMGLGSVASAQALAEFEWQNLSGTQVKSWTQASNWIAPSSPPGQANYPDDPNHVNVDEDAIGPVVGANLSVGLTDHLTVSLPSDITIASLKIGVDNFNTTINGPGILRLQNSEPNITDQIPDPDPNATPGAMVDEYTFAYNASNALVTSVGNASTNNVINATVGSTSVVEFAGTKSINLAGGFNEIAVNTMDTAANNNTTLRSHIGVFDMSQPISSQPRVIVSGLTRLVIDTGLNADEEEVDIPLFLQGGGSYEREFVSVNNTETAMGHPHGILDLVGGISDPATPVEGIGARIEIGTVSRANSAIELPTVVLYDNNDTGGTSTNAQLSARIVINRSNVVMLHNNAFGTGQVLLGNPANELGYNLIVLPGPGEDANVERVIANEFSLPHDVTIKGTNSLRWTGDTDASNSGAWVNMLPTGKTLTLEGTIYTSENPNNFYGFDGPGRTVVRGAIVNDLPGGTSVSTRIEKHGTGTVVIESSTAGNTNTFSEGSNSQPTILIGGGNLRFQTIGDMGSGRVASVGGAIGVNSGTIAALSTIGTRFNNLAGLGTGGTGGVSSFSNWDHGALMLVTAADRAANINFSSLTNVRDMSIAAPEEGALYTGTLTPSATSRAIGNIANATTTYRLGGGTGTLTMQSGALSGGNSLLATNGGDYRNPNGEDRVQVGMVKLQGTNSYTGNTAIMGKYQTTLQDVAAADDWDLAQRTQYHGTTLAVERLGDGASSLGTATSADSLLIQGSTLRYEGPGDSTSRLFTVGTHGATLDASGTGALNFTSSSALGIEIAEPRSTLRSTFYSDISIAGNLTYTDDLVVGMGVSYGAIQTTVTDIRSHNIIDLAVDETLSINSTTLTFTEPERVLALTGSNTGDNTLSPVIQDSTNGGVVSLEKSGVGKWILDNAGNNYSGDTSVLAGTLSIESPFLHDDSSVMLYSDGTFDLNFTGSDTVNLLYFDDALMTPGTWGSLASSAANKRDWFTGLGILNVTDGAEIVGLPGDYNLDGVVDAADYTVWRDNLGLNSSALNGNGTGDASGLVVQADYSLWRSNYGASLAISLGSSVSNVPEPHALVLLMALAALPAMGRQRG